MRSRRRIRVAVLAAAALLLAAGAASVALAGSEGTPKQRATQKLKNALQQERAALKDLRDHKDASADKHLLKSQKALKGAANILGSGSSAGWDAYDAWNHDEDALDDPYRGDAIDDVLDGIDHKLWALQGLTGRPYVLGWPLEDFGGNSLFYGAGGLYSTGYNANAIGLVKGKTAKTFAVPTPSSGLRSVTLGSDGAIWFTENNACKLGRLDLQSHAITEYPLANELANPYGITTGPDKALWYTEPGVNMIGRSTVSGQMLEYPIPTANSYPVWITKGPDKALWFTELEGNKIGRITTSGQVTEYSLPTPGAEPAAIAPGPGGLWFTEFGSGKVGLITTKGKIEEFPTSDSASGPDQIVRGPDGDMWFTEYNANKIGLVTPGGHIHEFKAAGNPSGIAASKTTLFYEEYSANKTVGIKLKF